jgi:hypothetical protein
MNWLLNILVKIGLYKHSSDTVSSKLVYRGEDCKKESTFVFVSKEERMRSRSDKYEFLKLGAK